MSPFELSGRWMLERTDWLNTRLYETPIFFFDLWSCVHFWCGFMLFAILACLRSRFLFLKLFLLLFGCEIGVEVLAHSFFLSIHAETFKNPFTDILMGMAGGFGAGLFFNALDRLNVAVESSSRWLDRITSAIAGPTVAFLWVGSYGYQYNVAALSNHGINWFAAGLWSIGHGIILELNSRWKKRVPTTWIRLSLLWLFYFASLLVVEYIGYYLLGIHEAGRPACPALVFGLVHGTPVLHGFYLTAPFWSLAVQYGLRDLFRGAFRAHVDLSVFAPPPVWMPVPDSCDPQ